MFNLLNRTMRNKKGFTLTELIVVVAILGILVAVAAPSIIGYINDAKVNTDDANAKTLENVVGRQVAKGTIDLSTSTDAEIIAAIQTEINPVPPCEQTNYKFVLTRATGKVAPVLSPTAVVGTDLILNP